MVRDQRRGASGFGGVSTVDGTPDWLDLPAVPESRLDDALRARLVAGEGGPPAPPPWTTTVSAVLWWHRAAPAAADHLPGCGARPPAPADHGRRAGALPRQPGRLLLGGLRLTRAAAPGFGLPAVTVPFIAVDSLAASSADVRAGCCRRRWRGRSGRRTRPARIETDDWSVAVRLAATGPRIPIRGGCLSCRRNPTADGGSASFACAGADAGGARRGRDQRTVAAVLAAVRAASVRGHLERSDADQRAGYVRALRPRAGPGRAPIGISLNGERPTRKLPGSCGDDADASGRHRGGDRGTRRGRQRLVAARQRPPGPAGRRGVAGVHRRGLGARPSEVLFTGGGTESDNLAVKGLYWARRAADPRRRRVLVSAVEHHAVLDAAEWLAAEQGAEVDWLPVDAAGRVEPETLRAAIAARAGDGRAGQRDVGEQRDRHRAGRRRAGRRRPRVRRAVPHRRGAGRRQRCRSPSPPAAPMP